MATAMDMPTAMDMGIRRRVESKNLEACLPNGRRPQVPVCQPRLVNRQAGFQRLSVKISSSNQWQEAVE
jgi:hypothetical protein